ncbi:transglutaminase family protein [Mesorhizobium sp. ANAO-SY3R2]|uniref:transglutaminase-like domain-containing protein n=1 Tax=Mesorhizobium sp. ANAO-SY3R2 TaxID=3166644 RepID=UPI0036711AA7
MTADSVEAYLRQTALLDYGAPSIRSLVAERGWGGLSEFDRIGAAYSFVRDEIAFGYNRADDIKASEVLDDGYGQCNTKGTLLMALLRALELPCRLHGFTIHKALQRGVVPELVYGLAPDSILHSWVEVHHGGRWVNLEGFILDAAFLQALQERFASSGEALCGYGAGTDCLSAPPVDWVGESTYIQKTGINADLGLFDSPDEFYRKHRQDFGWVRGMLYRYGIRHWMNARVRRVRQGKIPPIPEVGDHAQAEPGQIS